MRGSNGKGFILGVIAVVVIGFVGWYFIEGPGDDNDLSIEVDENGIDIDD